MSNILLVIALVTCLISLCLFIFGNTQKAGRREKIGIIFYKASICALTLLIVLRWLKAERLPFANMYEALVLYAWAIGCVYLVFEYLYKAVLLAPFAALIDTFLLVVLLFQDATIKPLMPALQSKWMAIHVTTYFIGYAAITLAFMLSVSYLMLSRKKKTSLLFLNTLDNLSYQLIIFAFPFLTLGMTTGSMWANFAWGSYWFWDPKETCSLITWLVYLVYLHGRLLLGWQRNIANWLSTLGFVATLFTFIGVNYILPGLHSYA
ncbi:MAG: c-type cytochrome biogenesis protein CcsB [Candidatus Omnitrophica bacterium]|nr:c-type cytochrome biogenesis protein CcsB [Candidatus Omnitrophota bacterium]